MRWLEKRFGYPGDNDYDEKPVNPDRLIDYDYVYEHEHEYD